MSSFAIATNLAASSALVIDTTAPTISGVSSTTAAGTYKADDAISIQVTFSETVNVTGTPQLTLETGGSDAVVDYASGSGSNVLTFTYTVSAGHTSSDLDYASTTALALNGGTIQDVGENNATLTLAAVGDAGSLGANEALVIDTTAPTISGVDSTTAAGTYNEGDAISIQVTFSEAVTVTGTPQLTLETGGSDAVVDYASGSDTNVLTFTYTVASGHTSSDLDYASTTALALNSGTIKDAGGNNATLTLAAVGDAGSLGANEAFVIDTTAPTISSVTSTTADGTYNEGDSVNVTVTFSEAVTLADGNLVVTLETGATDRTVTITTINSATTASGTYTVQAGDTSSDLTVSGIALSAGTLTDGGGNTMSSFAIATNLAASSALVIDTTAPTVTGVDSSTDPGTYKQGDAISIQVTFSEAVTVTGTPQLTLETGTSDAVVDYVSGSTTNVLTFTYTVGAGETSSDRDYASTTALALNGGTIQDVGENNATLTLAAVGDAG